VGWDCRLVGVGMDHGPRGSGGGFWLGVDGLVCALFAVPGSSKPFGAGVPGGPRGETVHFCQDGEGLPGNGQKSCCGTQSFSQCVAI